MTSSLIESIDWQQLIELGFISHPDAAHHGRLLLSQNFPEFEHTEQFTHKVFGFTVLPLHAAKAFHAQGLIKIHTLKKSVNESLYLCINRQSILASRTKFIKSLVVDYLS